MDITPSNIISNGPKSHEDNFNFLIEEPILKHLKFKEA
jgi:hypothetical protein